MIQDSTEKTIKDFTDLLAWQYGHKLVIEIYQLTLNFPNSEIYGLTSQMRRAAVSITSNLAEGFGRRTYKEKVQFYHMALGSLIELQNQLYIAKDIGYISLKIFENIYHNAITVNKLTQGLLKKTKLFGSQS